MIWKLPDAQIIRMGVSLPDSSHFILVPHLRVLKPAQGHDAVVNSGSAVSGKVASILPVYYCRVYIYKASKMTAGN